MPPIARIRKLQSRRLRPLEGGAAMKVFATVLSLVSAAVFAVLCGLLVWRDYGLWVIAVCAAIFLVFV